jgi:hypothetical protein
MTALVMCPCCLHKFFINSRLKKTQTSQAPIRHVVSSGLEADTAEISIAGGVMLVRCRENRHSLEELLDGGDHFDEFDHNHLRGIERTAASDADGHLPCDELHDVIVQKGLVHSPAWNKT